jgi:hypothetical protein
MPTGLDKYWDTVVDQVKRRVERDGSAGIVNVIAFCKAEGIVPNATNLYDEDIEIILGKILQSGEYLTNPSQNDNHIKINPSFKLDQNIITTNTSIQTTNTSVVKLNKTLFWTNIISTGIALITGFFIAKTFFKNDSKDVQLLNVKLDRQEQILDSMLWTQVALDSSLRKAVKDSFYQKHR